MSRTRRTPFRRSRQAQLLVGLLSAASVVVLDFFIVLACLPAIEASLGASKAELQLVLAAYAIANASLLVVGGRLGDLFGRRRVLIWGLATFAAATAGCAFATSPMALIGFRVLQGLAGAMTQPQVLGLLSVNFEPAQRGRVFNLYAASLGCAGIVAQLIGGALVNHLPVDQGWRACFLLSLPLCVVAMFFSRTARDGPGSPRQKIDAVGALLLSAALTGVCAFLILGREQGWPGWSFSVLGIGLASAALLWGWQALGARTGDERIVPAGILGTGRFWLSLLMILAFYGGVASFYFVLALELRVGDGFQPIQVGLFFAWMAAWFVGTSSSTVVKLRLGDRWAAVGLCTLAAGHVLMLVPPILAPGFGRVVAVAISCALQGIGLGCLMGPLMANALSRVRRDQASVGGGIAATTQQIGNSLGIAAVGLAYFSGTEAETSVLRAVAYFLMLLVVLVLLLRAAVRGAARTEAIATPLQARQ